MNFTGLFSELAEHDYDGWAALEWECALKHPEDGARDGAAFIRYHIIRVANRNFAASGAEASLNRSLLGLG